MYFRFQKNKNHSTAEDDYTGTIYAIIRRRGANSKYSIGYQMTKQEWEKYKTHDYKSNMLIPSIHLTYGQFADILGNIKHYFDSDYEHDAVRYMLQEIKAITLSGGDELKCKKPKDGYIDNYIRTYYDDLLTGKRLKSGRSCKVNEEYAKVYYKLYKRLVKFQYAIVHRYTFSEVNMQFQRDFVSWLKKQGFMPNGIHESMKRLRTVMITAFQEGETDNDIKRLSSFVPKENITDEVYLTRDMINYLRDIDLSSKEKVNNLIMSNVEDNELVAYEVENMTEDKARTLRFCRDIFIVGCFTGQRYADYSRISRNMLTRINGEWFIKIIQTKTEKKVFIPLDKSVKNILDKYNGVLPTIEYKKFLTYLIRLFSYIGWNWDARIDMSRMGKKRGERFCDMITARTARRSFATNAYEYGINIHSIMAVTGHSSEVVFRRYLKLNAEDRCLKATNDLENFMVL